MNESDKLLAPNGSNGWIFTSDLAIKLSEVVTLYRGGGSITRPWVVRFKVGDPLGVSDEVAAVILCALAGS